MENPAAPLDFIYEYVDKDTFKKYFRLVIIVCIYVFVRGYYSTYAKQRQIRRQLDLDSKEKERAASKEASLDDAKKELEDVDEKNLGFGWGKATRRKVKTQEKVMQITEEEVRKRKQTAYDAAEDHDIDHLLE